MVPSTHPSPHTENPHVGVVNTHTHILDFVQHHQHTFDRVVEVLVLIIVGTVDGFGSRCNQWCDRSVTQDRFFSHSPSHTTNTEAAALQHLSTHRSLVQSCYMSASIGVILVCVVAIVVPLTMLGQMGWFLCGGLVGVYVAQNYTTPNVSDHAQCALKWVQDWERECKKPGPNGPSPSSQSATKGSDPSVRKS